jgi:hypothetical protein
MVTPAGRRAALAAVALAAAVAAAACSSSGSPKAQPSRDAGAQRAASVGPLVVQCALGQHITSVATSAAKYSGQLPSGQQWLQAGQLVLTSGNGSQFNAWYQGHVAGLVVRGQRLEDWAGSLSGSGKLPAALCGAGASAKSLYEQIYAQYPSMRKDDPWRS